MATATKSKYEQIIDEIMEGMAEHLDSLPEAERRKRITDAASYSFDARRPHSKTSIPKNGTGRSHARRRASK
jgi:hypothetical protein